MPMASPRRTAVISDLHGNRWAVAAVLEDIRRRRIDRLVNLGDALYGPLDPAGTADLLLANPMPTVRGNQDRVILRAAARSDPPTLTWVRSLLRPEHRRWLERLPFGLILDDGLGLFHASPDDDSAYLLWDVGPTGALRRSPEAIARAADTVSCPVMLCGHDHVPAEVLLPDGRLIVDPGSVGLPAYSDDLPCAHVMRSGSPHARYSIIAPCAAGWRIERVAVPYDWQAAARTAEANGRPDWAAWLRSGWA